MLPLASGFQDGVGSADDPNVGQIRVNHFHLDRILNGAAVKVFDAEISDEFHDFNSLLCAFRVRPGELLRKGSLIPSFQTTAKRPLKDRHCETVSAKRAMSGVSLWSGMVGMRS